MNQPPRARWPGIRALALLVVVGFAGWQWFRPSAPDSAWQMGAAEPLPDGKYHCEYVIDGDTIIVWPYRETGPDSNYRIRLRLLGIDAPEDGAQVDPFGPESTAFMKDLILSKDVQLQWDKRRIDRYGRRLGYIYYEGSLVNQTLVANGLARIFAYTGDNPSIARELLRAEIAAREGKIGLWSISEEEPAANTNLASEPLPSVATGESPQQTAEK